ncbi:rCG51908 [Rattus norvegicus]|uniref:RCG51908 n=1 Tax=Rattus norvegicus TaxID=10116 RepID=A6K358_RAT|nr:rCG51908 [Rattus norvegicus]
MIITVSTHLKTHMQETEFILFMTMSGTRFWIHKAPGTLTVKQT